MFPVAVGLSLRTPWIDDLLRLEGQGPVEVLEVMVDDLIHDAALVRRVRRCGARWPLLGHGVALGIGNAEGIDEGYLEAVKHVVEYLRVRWYSDHLCFLSAGGVELGHFAPLTADAETLRVLASNGAMVRNRIPVPFLLENPADVLGVGAEGPEPGAALGRAFADCIEAADVGAILDVTNLLYNARNDGFDPATFIDALSLDRVVQVHVAGGRKIDGLWIDSHDRPVEEDSLALLGVVAQRCPNLRAVTLEWDEDLPPLSTALEQLDRIRIVLDRGGRR